MPRLHRPLLSILLALVAAGTTTAAWADQPRDRDRDGSNDQRRDKPRQDDALSDSVRRIERSTRGQVLSAERMQSDGRDVNRIKVVDDRGRVRVYMDDPQQGRSQRAPTRDDDD